MTSTAIPVLHLHDFNGADLSKRNDFVKNLGEAYEKIGFIALSGHHLSASLSEDLYREVAAFFTLDAEAKLKYEIPGLAGQRGYTSFGREKAKDSNTGDLKEFWHFGQYVEDGEALDYPENVLVTELPSFNEIGKRVYQKLESTGREVLRAIALYLGLDEFYFDDKIHNGNSILRPIHYPPINSAPENAVRAAQHEDINLITLLMGASAAGLEVLNKQNQWLAVNAEQDQLIVNVGDMLQRLTNNVLKSTTHRVVNPPKEQWATPRYSIPFFLHPRSEMRLDCLPNCISESNLKQYEDISAVEYLDERLKEIGLKN